jgi:hypothetical protein
MVVAAVGEATGSVGGGADGRGDAEAVTDGDALAVGMGEADGDALGVAGEGDGGAASDRVPPDVSSAMTIAHASA